MGVLRAIGRLRDRIVSPVERRLVRELELRSRTSTQSKVAQRHLWQLYRNLAQSGSPPRLSETGFRCFSQFEEDGKLLFIFAALGMARGTFVDIGAADGVNSNCGNFALNFGWNGVFVDGGEKNVRKGKEFYGAHPDSWAYPPKFVRAMITRENINAVLTEAGVEEDVDLMSIDIDGNDYWVWEAITCVKPKVVIVETHIEFGLNSIVVPYDPEHVYPGRHPDYFGASPVAMAKLANKKGYRLVGANDYGFNTIYVQRGMAENVLPEVSVEEILSHPRNVERYKLFEPIKDWEYIEV